MNAARRTFSRHPSPAGCWRLPVIVAAAFLAASDAGAQTVHPASPDNYLHLITLLRPGDTLALSAGEYRDGLPAHGLSGEPGRPITITGPESGPSATLVARPGHSTVGIVDSRYLVIRNLMLEGNNLPVDAVKADKPSHYAHDITLENLVIRGHGNNQQTVGISTKCPAWNWVIRGNTIVGAGTGMYLGDSDGSAPFVAGLIERNLIVDTIGYNLQVKHQQPRPDIPGLPAGRSMTIIRHNVFAKADGVATESPRPNVLVGHFPLAGAGADDDYAVYGNFFYQNRDEALFQGEGNVALYGNLFVNDDGDAIRIQPHNDIPRRIVIAFNTVVAKGAGVSLIQKEGAPRYPQTVSANAVFAGVPIRGGRQAGNLAAPMSEANVFLSRPFAPLGELDLYPQRRWPRTVATKSAAPARFPDWTRDFNGRPRLPGSIGAYGASGSNPGWLPRLERKPDQGPAPPSTRPLAAERGRAAQLLAILDDRSPVKALK
jgi:hypothetical protein